MQKKLFHKDFTLMTIGQIISIFGNQILSFSLSLYVLDITGSASMFATILVVSKIPSILLSLAGGALADRLPRKMIMVVLDFFTAFSIFCFYFMIEQAQSMLLIGCFMVLLAIIQSFYQPSVQASIPSITAPENLTSANSVTTGINAVASLAAPALGGMLYGFFGIMHILIISAICFLLSAILELFLTIPFVRQPKSKHFLTTITTDFKEAITFVTKGHPVFLQMMFTLTGLNFLITAMFYVGLPYMIKIQLGLSSQLYGLVESSMAVGMMIGALLAMKLKNRIHIHNAYIPLQIGILTLIFIGFAMISLSYPMTSYIIIFMSVLIGMSFISLFNIATYAYMQGQTPTTLLGKVSAFLTTITQCAVPLGQALFGLLYDWIPEHSAIIVITVCLLSYGLSLFTKKSCLSVNDEMQEPK